ncbi:MAG: NUDIX domain-containing protein [Clostridia bacterium]|nr:NUDIX domain-containing protein [Clostridia bacterium]
MRQVDILGDNRFESYSKTRCGSRAVILRGEEILLSHEILHDLWMLPGGGQEAGETFEECCLREVQEETGYRVRICYPLLTLNEYYEEYRYISRYYVCEIEGSGAMRLTPQEEKRGLRPDWLPLSEALTLFSRHQDWAAKDEERRGIYLREYTALKEYRMAAIPERQ